MTPTERQRGFSLLEMLVAVSVLALALGALYQAASGATRNVRSSERYAYGVELARSLVASYARVPAEGVAASGETAGGYQWRVQTQPIAMPSGPLEKVPLFALEVGVGWYDGSKRREIVLNTTAEGLLDGRR